MNVAAGLAAATVAAGAAVGFASPARAADDFSGTFIPNGPGTGLFHVDQNLSRDQKPIPMPMPPKPQSGSFGHETST
jgi:hypothetical protein